MHSSQPNSGPIHRALTEAAETVERLNISGEESLRVFEMYFTAAVLRRYSGNKCHCARRFGVHRNTMGRRIDELELQSMVDQLRLVQKDEPQLKLFKQSVRKGPVRAGFAQDALVLNRYPQGKKGASPQLSNRVAAGSA